MLQIAPLRNKVTDTYNVLHFVFDNKWKEKLLLKVQYINNKK